MTNNQQITYTNELQRKGIHITSMLIPIIYYFIDRSTDLSILFPLTCITLIIDLFIHYNPTFRSFSHGMIGHLMRPHELNRTSLVLNGASWVMIAAVLTVFVFPKTIAIIAFSIVILCDMFAALIGRKIGKTKFIDKSLEGSLTFLIVGIIVCYTWTQIFHLDFLFFIAVSTGTFFAAIAEAAAYRLKVDDNIVIPIVAGGISWLILYYFNGSY